VPYRDKNRDRAARRALYQKRKTEEGCGMGWKFYRAKQSSPRSRATQLWHGAIKRGRLKSLPVTISVEWVEERLRAGVCEVSGLPFVLSIGRSAFAPSLDRRDPAQGYTPENTQVVVWCYNAAKGTFTHAEVLTLAEALCRRIREKN
jgi:hypothetical protein